MPRPSPPFVGAEAPSTAQPTTPADRNIAVGSHGHRCALADALTPRLVKRPGDLDL